MNEIKTHSIQLHEALKSLYKEGKNEYVPQPYFQPKIGEYFVGLYFKCLKLANKARTSSYVESYFILNAWFEIDQ